MLTFPFPVFSHRERPRNHMSVVTGFDAGARSSHVAPNDALASFAKHAPLPLSAFIFPPQVTHTCPTRTRYIILQCPHIRRSVESPKVKLGSQLCGFESRAHHRACHRTKFFSGQLWREKPRLSAMSFTRIDFQCFFFSSVLVPRNIFNLFLNANRHMDRPEWPYKP